MKNTPEDIARKLPLWLDLRQQIGMGSRDKYLIY